MGHFGTLHLKRYMSMGELKRARTICHIQGNFRQRLGRNATVSREFLQHPFNPYCHGMMNVAGFAGFSGVQRFLVGKIELLGTMNYLQ
mmetsp:Transcript_27139/g.55544  ORF Transcript_27139/g.55544 Transcript_27139/m.55544 type:complete len:88 (-) Transcript_27139:691-954(-)